MLSVNDNAPDFNLKNTNKDDVKLSDFNDKTVILAFYPGAFTGVCDTEMCAFQDNLSMFNNLGTTVLGISVDSPWANGAFSKQYNLEFDRNQHAKDVSHILIILQSKDQDFLTCLYHFHKSFLCQSSKQNY